MINDNSKDRPIGRNLVFWWGVKISAPQARKKSNLSLTKQENFYLKFEFFGDEGGWGGGGVSPDKKNQDRGFNF